MSSQPPTRRQAPMLTLLRVRGVPVMVSPTWLVIGLLLTIVYGPVIHDAVGTIGTTAAYLTAFGFSVLFALCILAHEIGHTLVSTALGYPVKRVVLFLLGGVSEIEGEATRPRDELAIAASGPLVSIVISAVAFGGFALLPDPSVVSVIFFLLAWSNVVLAVFNLLPGLPLDGGRILRAAVWGAGASTTTATKVAAWCGRGLAVALVVVSILFSQDADVLPAYFVTLLLALYLWFSATASLRAAALQSRLPKVSVAALLRPGMLVTADVSVAEALRRVWASGARGLVVVDSEGRPFAIVDEQRIAALPDERRAWTSVGDIARGFGEGGTVPVDIDAAALLGHVQRHPAPEYLVLGPDGAPAGIIATADFAHRLREHASR